MIRFLGKKTLNAYHKRLDNRLSELEKSHAATEESRAPVALDQTTQGRLSRMDALQVQAMALETDRRRKIEIKRVEAAILRMENDEFGYCASCGDEIEVKRLDNDPACPNCISCARGSLS
jgi:DnaK suppressor protein